MLANLAAFSATLLLTTSLSYLMPVISAALKRRELATNNHSVGTDPMKIVRRCWTEPGAHSHHADQGIPEELGVPDLQGDEEF